MVRVRDGSHRCSSAGEWVSPATTSLILAVEPACNGQRSNPWSRLAARPRCSLRWCATPPPANRPRAAPASTGGSPSSSPNRSWVDERDLLLGCFRSGTRTDRSRSTTWNLEVAGRRGSLLVVGFVGLGQEHACSGPANGLVPVLDGRPPSSGEVRRVSGRSTRTPQAPVSSPTSSASSHQDPRGPVRRRPPWRRNVAFVPREPRAPGRGNAAPGRRSPSTRSASRTLREPQPGNPLRGAKRQRAAIAGAPRRRAPPRSCFDEPTSQLDPQGAEDVLARGSAGSTRIWGTTIVPRRAPARTRRTAGRPARSGWRKGRINFCHRQAPGRRGSPTIPVRRASPGSDALLGWDPPPLTVRDARGRPARSRWTHRPDPACQLVVTRGPPGENPPERPTARRRARSSSGSCMASTSRSTGARSPRCSDGNGAGKEHAAPAHRGGLLAPRTAGRIERRPTTAYGPPGPERDAVREPTVRAEIAETLRLLGRRDPGRGRLLAGGARSGRARRTTTRAASRAASVNGFADRGQSRWAVPSCCFLERAHAPGMDAAVRAHALEQRDRAPRGRWWRGRPRDPRRRARPPDARSQARGIGPTGRSSRRARPVTLLFAGSLFAPARVVSRCCPRS